MHSDDTSASKTKRKIADPIQELEEANFELYKKVGAMEAQLTDKVD